MGAWALGIYERSPKKDILVLDDLVDALTFGNVPQVKTALTTVLLALAIYQVAMMSVGYGKVRVPFLKPKAASLAHRSVGDAILPIAVARRVDVSRVLRRGGRDRARGLW